MEHEDHHKREKENRKGRMEPIELIQRHIYLRAANESWTASATRISARSGRVRSTPRSRRLPLSHVPLRLWSTIKKRPLNGSRRSRRCSRETSSLVHSAKSTSKPSPP